MLCNDRVCLAGPLEVIDRESVMLVLLIPVYSTEQHLVAAVSTNSEHHVSFLQR